MSRRCALHFAGGLVVNVTARSDPPAREWQNVRQPRGQNAWACRPAPAKTERPVDRKHSFALLMFTR